MNRHSALISFVCTALLACGCSSSEDERACTTVPVPAVQVQVVRRIDCGLIKVVLTADGFEEQPRGVPSPNGGVCAFDGAVERPGTYRVDISAPGFRPATMELTATRKGCLEPAVTRVELVAE